MEDRVAPALKALQEREGLQGKTDSRARTALLGRMDSLESMANIFRRLLLGLTLVKSVLPAHQAHPVFQDSKAIGDQPGHREVQANLGRTIGRDPQDLQDPGESPALQDPKASQAIAAKC